MNKKVVIQVLMIFLIVLITYLFYAKYFKKNQKKITENIKLENLKTSENTTSNYIDDINYTSLDAKGNRYLITAQQAEIVKDNPDTMFLENVIAYIYLKDSDTVKITSDFGKYNSKNYDTIFFYNLIVL